MLGLESKDLMLVILGAVYAVYCGWAKYCEHRWPAPEIEPETVEREKS